MTEPRFTPPRRALLATAGATLAMPWIRTAQAQSTLRFALDWTLQGNHGMWALAEDRGIYRREGLSVRMDRGFGSGDTVVKVGSGAYDVGFADFNSAVKFNAENPASRLVMLYPVFDRTAAAIVTMKGRGIEKPQDVVGKNLGAPEGEGSRLLFPAFARVAGIDASRVRWLTVTPQLREPMLAQGRANAITGFITSGIFSLRGLGIPDQDIVTLLFSDVGADFFSTSLITTRRWANANRPAVTGLIRGLIRAQYDSLRDPAAAIANLRRREALTDVALETERLRMSLDRLTFTPHVRQNGFGQVDMVRLQRSVDAVREAFGISRPMAASDIYDASFLPPAADLRQA